MRASGLIPHTPSFWGTAGTALAQVPQITIQSINNDLMDDWDGFSVTSVVISAFVTVDVL